MESVGGDVTRLGTKVIEAADREITRERELFADEPKGRSRTNLILLSSSRSRTSRPYSSE